MRIQHNISALNSLNQLKKNDNALSKNLQRLSSGYRINSAADDAAGLTISEKMRSQINGLNQAESNAEAGMSLTQTADGNLDTVHSILQRMNQLAEESANGIYQDDTDRKNLQLEFGKLADQITNIGTNSNFNGKTLFTGSVSTDGITFQVGIDSTSNSAITLKIDTLSSSALGVDSAGASIGTQAAATAALGAIATAINSVSNMRANIGATQNQLDYTADNLKISSQNLTSAESNIRDVDMSSEIIDMTKNQILEQAATSMLSAAKSMPQSVLSLLQQ